MEIDHVPIGSRVYRALLQSTPCGGDLVAVCVRWDAISGWFDGDLRAWLRAGRRLRGRCVRLRAGRSKEAAAGDLCVEAIDLSGAGWDRDLL
jgi:hypothetical protein